MSKILKLFSLVFVLIFSIVSADPETGEDKFRSVIFEKYMLTVTEVDPELHCFRLPNRLVCNIPIKDWKTAILPEVGDRVCLIPIGRLHSHRSTHIEQGELRADIKGPDGLSKGEVTVWISDESEYQLYFVGVELVCTQPNSGWVFPNSVYEEIILLSDGSRWTRKREQESVFTRGDRIIVSHLKENEYLLIDLDNNFSFKEIRAGKNLVVLSNEAVEPFNKLKITKG